MWRLLSIGGIIMGMPMYTRDGLFIANTMGINYFFGYAVKYIRIAVREDDFESVEFIMKHTEKSHKRQCAEAGIREAVEADMLKYVKYITEEADYPKDWLVYDVSDGYSVLGYAITKDYEDIVTYLLIDLGVDIHCYDDIVMKKAVKENNKKLIEFIRSHVL